MPNLQNLFKAIPSTDKCLDALARAAGDGSSPDAVRLLAESPRPLIREAVSGMMCAEEKSRSPGNSAWIPVLMTCSPS
jgi:hypothetical protein